MDHADTPSVTSVALAGNEKIIHYSDGSAKHWRNGELVRELPPGRHGQQLRFSQPEYFLGGSAGRGET